MFSRNASRKGLSADGRTKPDAPVNCSGAAMTSHPTKQALRVSMLQDENGVPLTAIVAATGWLPHTARAALTGLRKKGYAIVLTNMDSETRYMISVATK